MSDIIFREKPCYNDLKAIESILKRTGFFSEEEQEIGISLLQERLEEGEQSGYYFLFAEQDSNVVGYTCYGPIPMTQNGFDLYWIAVDPSYQNRGIGTMLLTHTEDLAKIAGADRLYAETSSKAIYLSTQQFYEHHGFFLEARQKNYYAPGDDRLMYTKILKGNQTDL